MSDQQHPGKSDWESDSEGAWQDWLRYNPDEDDAVVQSARFAADRRRRQTLGLAGCAVLAVAAIASVIVIDSGTDTPSAVPVVPSATVAAPPHASDGCASHTRPRRITGAEPGSTVSGPDAIMRFQHAYRVERSGVVAAAVLAPGATATWSDGTEHPLTADGIQAGIDAVPAGTRYCLVIVPATRHSHRWDVELSQQQPGRPPVMVRQAVTTTTADGRVLITAVDAN